MRYMIAHMIGGEAKEYHKNLSNVLASAYHLRSVTLQIDPHLTFKAPFDALSSDLDEVVRLVQKFVSVQSPFPYTLKGFGSFDDRTVYMDVAAEEELVTVVQDLKEQLKHLPWIEYKPHEEETKLHATLCYPQDATQTQEILKRLNERGGKEFTCTLDTIALLKKDERRWEVIKEFRFGGSDTVLGDIKI